MRQFTCAICGCGSRGYSAYGAYIANHSDRVKIVACADIRPERLKMMQETHGVPESACYNSGMEMLDQPKLADIMVIAIQDQDHVSHAIRAMQQGYDVICEKPISPNLGECIALQEAAHKYGRHILICHVLRYAPFFTTIKSLIMDGAIGQIMNIDMVEHVQYWHQAHSFVRGNWRRSDTTSPMILAKSCHDMDMLRWLMDCHCESVSSFGDLSFFNADHAPVGAAMRCLDCKYVDTCEFSAKKLYITGKRHGVANGITYWPVDVVASHPTVESVTEALKEGPYGRCVFHCDNDVVDHQVVAMKFETGAVATFTMSAFCNSGARTIEIMGTKGDIRADMTGDKIILSQFGQESREISLENEFDKFAGHGGGDGRLFTNFMDLLEGKTDEKRTSVDASVESHVMALAAEYSRVHGGQCINLDDFVKNNGYAE